MFNRNIGAMAKIVDDSHNIIEKVASVLSQSSPTGVGLSMIEDKVADSTGEAMMRAQQKANEIATPEGAKAYYGDKGGKFLGAVGALYGASKGKSLKGAAIKALWHGAAGYTVGKAGAGEVMKQKRKLMKPDASDRESIYRKVLKEEL